MSWIVHSPYTALVLSATSSMNDALTSHDVWHSSCVTGYPPFWGQIDKLEPEEKQKKLSPRSSSLEEVVAGRLELKRRH